MCKSLQLVQAVTGFHCGHVQGILDSSQEERTDRQFFLTGFVSTKRKRGSSREILAKYIRDATIEELKFRFQKRHGYALSFVHISHEYPSSSQCQKKHLSPKTMVELTSHWDVTLVEELLRQRALWTKDTRNVYQSQRVGFEGCIGRCERRRQKPLLLIADAIKHYYYERSNALKDGRKRSWWQVNDEFAKNFKIDMRELSIRYRRKNTLEVQVKTDPHGLPSVVDCYISNRWMPHVRKYWYKAASYHFAMPYRSPNVVSFPQADILPPKQEARVPPELKLLATQMALTKQSNEQGVCTLEAPSQSDAWGQQLMGKYRNPRYSHDLQIVPLDDMQKKYNQNENLGDRRSLKRVGTPLYHIRKQRR